MSAARNELADIFTGHPVSFGAFPKRLMRGHAQEIADKVLSVGYRKPNVLGYVVVDRAGIFVGEQHKYRESAQDLADEWTADAKASGLDWDYRVAEIVEATA